MKVPCFSIQALTQISLITQIDFGEISEICAICVNIDLSVTSNSASPSCLRPAICTCVFTFEAPMRSAVAAAVFAFMAHPLFAEYQVFYENGKAGVRDDAGNILIPATHDALGWSDGTFSVVNNVTGYRQNTRWGLINLKKELVTKADFENLVSGGGDRVVASRWINPYTKKFGCIDLYGSITVPFHYDAISITGLRAIACMKNGARYEYGVIDLNNKTVVKVSYRDIRPVGSLRFAVQNFDLKTALFSEEGMPLTEFAIDSISTFRMGYAFIYEDLRVGLLDRFGEIVVKPSYRSIKIGDDGTVTGQRFPLWKELDARNVETRSISADDLRADSGFMRITVAGKQGTVDDNLQPVIRPRYEYIAPFVNNIAVARAGKYGIIRNDGTTLLPFEFDSLSVQNDLVRSLQRAGVRHHWSVYDTFGIKKTARTYEALSPYNGKFFPARRNGYWGAVNRYGEEFIPCVYDSIANFSYEYIAVRFKRLWGIIDENEKWVVGPQLSPVSLVNDKLYFEQIDSILFVRDFTGQIIYFTENELSVVENGFRENDNGNIKLISWEGISTYEAAPPSAVVAERVFEESEGYRGMKRDGQYGFIDQRGRLRIANRYEDIGKFKGGLAPVKILGRWGFVNVDDKIVIQPAYDRVTEFDQGISIVTRNGLQGVVSTDATVLLPVRYDSVIRRDDRLLLYSRSNAGLADLNGHVLIEPRFQTLSLLTRDLVLVSNGELWGVLTADGLPVIPMMYSALRYNYDTGKFLAKELMSWERLTVKKTD
jgi:hypothetical protein